VPFDLGKITDDILALRCRIPGTAASSLVFSGKFLATRYSECSTNRSVDRTEESQAATARQVSWIAPGDPLVFIDSSSHKISFPKGYKAVSMPGNFAFQIFYGHYDAGALRLPIWILLRNNFDRSDHNGARHLRIYLQRIHAEKEVLRLVLNSIASGKLSIEGNQTASDSLQRYLLNSTNKIGRLELKADLKGAEGIGALAASCLEFSQPGWRDALAQRLEQMDIRPTIRRNIEARVAREITLVNYGVINLDQSQHDQRRGIFMGDTFSNIQNSTIVNRSTVESAFNKTKTEMGDETAALLLRVAELVAKSGNKEAGELLDQFNEELSKPQPRKSLLRRSWDGLVAALPAVTSIAGAAAALAKLFA
jgi:hypothetical protein